MCSKIAGTAVGNHTDHILKMEAHMDAAARSSQSHSSIFYFWSIQFTHSFHYGRAKLLEIADQCQDYTFGNPQSIPPEIQYLVSP